MEKWLNTCNIAFILFYWKGKKYKSSLHMNWIKWIALTAIVFMPHFYKKPTGLMPKKLFSRVFRSVCLGKFLGK